MNIVVVGVGSVGLELVEQLIKEGHSITVIDANQDNVQRAVNMIDVKGFVGNGGSLDTLLEAGITNADLFIAVSEKDEINVLACMVAKSIGIQHTVARVRNPEFSSMALETLEISIPPAKKNSLFKSFLIKSQSKVFPLPFPLSSSKKSAIELSYSNKSILSDISIALITFSLPFVLSFKFLI